MNTGSDFRLPIHTTVRINDSISILLTSFSHKRPYTNGPTKATAYMTIFNGSASEELTLSVHGIDGKPAIKSFDKIEWNGYIFELIRFEYDQEIEIRVIR